MTQVNRDTLSSTTALYEIIMCTVPVSNLKLEYYYFSKIIRGTNFNFFNPTQDFYYIFVTTWRKTNKSIQFDKQKYSV